MIRPTAPQFQGKKLPVLMYVYGGPGSQQVEDEWKNANYWWFQMLAQKGYVVACVDNRGTGGRGTAFDAPIYRRLGEVEVQDQVRGVAWLAKQPGIDPDRVGIYGGSYGGYMTLLALISTTAAVATVCFAITTWRLNAMTVD